MRACTPGLSYNTVLYQANYTPSSLQINFVHHIPELTPKLFILRNERTEFQNKITLIPDIAEKLGNLKAQPHSRIPMRLCGCAHYRSFLEQWGKYYLIIIIYLT